MDDGILAVVAGADTVSSAMTSIFHCLLTHPETYRRLQEEVDRFYPPGEDACDSRPHREMTYLQAVMCVCPPAGDVGGADARTDTKLSGSIPR